MESKYNELEKLNQLKADGTITSAEYEIQKQKILSQKPNKTKRKSLKIIIAIIVVIAIFVIGLIFKKPISNYMLINDTEKKIGQINAEELENQIIKELENTPLNINTSGYKTTFEICNKDKNSKLSATVGANSIFYGPSENYFENFICAVISNDTEQLMIFPCFRITSNDSNKVENIQYISYDNLGISNNIHNTITNILKNKYGIKKDLIRITDIKTQGKYEEHFKQSKFIDLGEIDDLKPIFLLINKDIDKSELDKKLQDMNYKDITIFEWQNH